MSFFELPHIFVVFHPGAAGNFICALLDVALSNNETIEIKGTGSVHSSIDKKRKGVDYLSFGTECSDSQMFSSQEARIDFYLSGIQREYNNCTVPQISWTHDFSNIPIFRKYFPNSKIIVITQESVNEKLTVTFMNIIKNFMDKETVSPLTDSRKKAVTGYFLMESAKYLVRTLPNHKKQYIRDIINNYQDPKYEKLVTFLFLGVMVRMFKMQDLLENKNDSDRVNTLVYQDLEYVPDVNLDYNTGILGPSHDSFFDNTVYKIKYNDIVRGDHNAVISIIQQITNSTDIDILQELIYTYRSKQIQSLVDDPIGYYNNLSLALEAI